jgi:hypothetical protein
MLGSMLKKGFGKGLGNGAIDRAALARVKDLAREALALGEEVSISVNEINCTDPGCPGKETVILVMVPGERTRALKVMKPVEEVDEADIRQAAAS